MVLESTGAQNTVQKVRKLALVGIVPDHVFFSSDPAVSSPIFDGDKWESLMQKIPDPRSSGEVRVYKSGLLMRAILAMLTGWSQSWLVLIGGLPSDSARANLRSRRAPGLGRNHLSCKREYVKRKPSRCWLGAVPRYWNVAASCFHFISFAENTSAALAPEAGISQPILLLFFVFLLLSLSTKLCLGFFYLVSKFSGVEKKTVLT